MPARPPSDPPDRPCKPGSHGQSRSQTYRVWQHMIQRVVNPRDTLYPQFGGRGIRVDDRWRSFENFLADLGPRPSARHRLCRLSTDDDYSPATTFWGTAQLVARSRSSSQLVTFRGRTRPLADWCDSLGLTCDTVRSRLAAGWSVEDALTRPIRGARPR